MAAVERAVVEMEVVVRVRVAAVTGAAVQEMARAVEADY